MKLHSDVLKIQRKLSTNASNAAECRQLHFDKVAVNMGFANSNEAYKRLGMEFIKKAKIGAPSIKINN